MGAGAVAEVWKASIVGTANEYVAAKVMNPRQDLLEPTRLTNVRDRFRLEATNGSKLNHPNIIPVLDRGEYGGEPFLIMKLAEQSVQDVLDRKGSLSLDHSVRMISACLNGLRFLHGLNLVHRDVKPPNVLICDDVTVLGDLGIVRWTDMNPAFTGAGTLTRGSMQLGSWFYMAPEQQETPHEAVPASDVYALGITWYQCLTGKILTPAQIHAKKFSLPCAVNQINDTISQMVRYEISERPGLDDIMNTLTSLPKP
jgi:serine/threonine-protein kinase